MAMSNQSGNVIGYFVKRLKPRSVKQQYLLATLFCTAIRLSKVLSQKSESSRRARSIRSAAAPNTGVVFSGPHRPQRPLPTNR